MADIWKPEKRSQVMGLIRGKRTHPERLASKFIRDLGYSLRLNVKGLPGTPDIVIRKHKCVIFVNGCFWHYHASCRDGKIPVSNKAYWKPKLIANRKRDIKNIKSLRKDRWNVLTLWECQIKNKPEHVQNKISNFLFKHIRVLS